jgi:predicted DNA-binding transcriptional regulator AlpA
MAEKVKVFETLPDAAYVRESQLVQNSKRPSDQATKRPNDSAPLPSSAPTLWRKVKAGTFPRPVKLSERVTAWQVGAIRQWLNAQAGL